jgi:RNA-binding protein YlmH
MRIKNLLEKYSDPLDQRWLQKAWDQAEQAERDNRQYTSFFLDPRQQQLYQVVMNHFPGLNYLIYGGYAKAERARISFWPAAWGTKEFPPLISCLSIEGNFRFAEISHRDFLGAILSLGVRREMVGDIIYPAESTAQVLVDKQIAQYICTNLVRVHNVSVKVNEIPLETIVAVPEITKEIKGTVASLRLDAVASLGFGFSRSKIIPLIKGEQVKVNWQLIKNPASQLQEGDIISLRGKGRIEVVALEGESRKGRVRIRLKKYT